MRDINRIPKVLSAISNLWSEYPDFRFWQVIDFAIGYKPKELPADPYFWEEDDWIKCFTKAAEALRKSK